MGRANDIVGIDIIRWPQTILRREKHAESYGTERVIHLGERAGLPLLLLQAVSSAIHFTPSITQHNRIICTVFGSFSN
jgi:hypothetical protein